MDNRRPSKSTLVKLEATTADLKDFKQSNHQANSADGEDTNDDRANRVTKQIGQKSLQGYAGKNVNVNKDEPLTYYIGAKVLRFKNQLPYSESGGQLQRPTVEDISNSKYPDCYHPWQTECLEKIKEKDQVILSSTTGSGKTIVCYDWAKYRKHLAEQKTGKKYTVYVTSPIRVLSEQHFEELRAEGLNVGLETGEDKIVPNNADYICCTQEIYTNKYTNNPDAILVVDEFGYISEAQDRSRAYVDGLQGSMARSTLVCSATLGKMSTTKGYLEEVTGYEQYCYENHERLTELEAKGETGAENIQDAIVVSFSAENCRRVADTLLEARANGVVKSYEYRLYEDDDEDDEDNEEDEANYDEDDDEDDYYYRPQRSRRRGGREIVTTRQVMTPFEYSDERAERVEELAKELNIQNRELIEWAKYGISTYYGDMLPKEKKFTKQAFTEHIVDTIASTDAVALGVNFPARMIVFAQLAKYGEDGPISKNLYDQITGRAARLKHYSKGEIYYCNDFYWEDRNGYHHLLEKRGYDTGTLFEELQRKPNEELSVSLTPDYKALFRGKPIESEIDYIKQYSTVAVSEMELQHSCEEAIDCISPVIREALARAIEMNKKLDYGDMDDTIGHIQMLQSMPDMYTLEFDQQGQGIIVYEIDEYSDPWEGREEIHLGNNKLFREAMNATLSQLGCSNLEDAAHKLTLFLRGSYDLRLDPETNKKYALDVLMGEEEVFDERIRNSRNLRDLMGLRSYLLSLPRGYRKRYIDSIFLAEYRINALDETVLNERTGQITFSEISEALRSRFTKNASITEIKSKIEGKRNYTLTKEEAELLFANPNESNPGLVSAENHNSMIEKMRRQVPLKALIDSGIEIAGYLDRLDYGVFEREKNPQYCFQYLADQHLINNDIFRYFSHNKDFGEEFTQTTIDNLASLLAGGVEMDSLLGYTSFTFDEPSQIDAFVPFLDRINEPTDLFKRHHIANIETLRYASDKLGIDIDLIAQKKSLDELFARQNLSGLVAAGCQPNSLVDYCISNKLDERSGQEVLDLGATSAELVKYARWSWVSRNTQVLYERNMIDDNYLLNNLSFLDEDAVDIKRLVDYYKENRPPVTFDKLRVLYSRSLDKTIFSSMNDEEILGLNNRNLQWLAEKHIVTPDFSKPSKEHYWLDHIRHFIASDNINSVLSHGYIYHHDLVTRIDELLALSPSFKSMRRALESGAPPCKFLLYPTDSVDKLTRQYGRSKVEKMLRANIGAVINNFKSLSLDDEVANYGQYNYHYPGLEEMTNMMIRSLQSSEYSNMAAPLEQFLQDKRKERR